MVDTGAVWAPQSNTLHEPRLVKLAGETSCPTSDAMGGVVAGTTPQAFLADPADASGR